MHVYIYIWNMSLDQTEKSRSHRTCHSGLWLSQIQFRRKIGPASGMIPRIRFARWDPIESYGLHQQKQGIEAIRKSGFTPTEVQ